MSKPELTIPKVLQALAAELDQPVSIAQLCDLMKARWSVHYAASSVRSSLRWESITLGWVKINRSQYLPLRLVLDGLRFRCWPRPQDIAEGRLPIAHLRPFAGLRRQPLPVIYDEQGAILAVKEPRGKEIGFASHTAVDMRKWFQRHHFAAGDSILVEMRYRTRPELYFTYEPATAFQASWVDEQDRALLQAIVKQVDVGSKPCEEVILPIFASAPWRTAYPGRPWQYLVLSDPRLHLIEDSLIQASDPYFDLERLLLQRTPRDDVVFHPSLVEQAQRARLPVKQSVIDEITALQQEMQRSRTQDRQAGLWNGDLSRESRVADEEVDHFWETMDEMVGVAIDMSDQMTRAVLRMQEVLPPEVQQQLSEATPEEAEVILSRYLNYLLVKAPDLFPRIDVPPTSSSNDSWIVKRSVDSDIEPLDELDASGWNNDDDWDDDDEFGDGDWDDDEESAALAQSINLINQYSDYLSEMGKKRSTALVQTRLLKPYAQFLASFYQRSLHNGDYATLDEFLFYYYPNHNDVSERYIRDMCSALKQFYAFLRERGVIEDDRFAQAIWKRRDQAARLMTLCQKIERDYPDQPDLLAMLFKPYMS
ncbi:hypothetical protein [uncultured Chloroflexus sp.]|uniref:hypothetical protein n=1 Tax=uncultured Chloroflexus sp. TaxID=214040 RepID=UPI00262653A7|nr:hypothetical protein [uncultured Chloroflexus sp.]